MCKLSDKVGQHVKKRSPGRIIGTHTHIHIRSMCCCVFASLCWSVFECIMFSLLTGSEQKASSSEFLKYLMVLPDSGLC